MGHFSITKRPLKPNLLPNLKYFQIIFEDLGLFSSFEKLILREKSKKHEKNLKLKVSVLEKKITSDTDTEIGLVLVIH